MNATDIKLAQIQTLKVNITSSMDVSRSGQYFSIVTRQRQLRSAMFQYRLEVYSLHNLTRLAATSVYTSYIEQKTPCALVPGDKEVVVGARNHIIFYDMQLNEKHRVLHEQQNVYDLAVSPDGIKVAMVGDNKVLIWDSLTFHTIKMPFEISLARSCKFSADNRFIGVATTSTVTVYEIVPFGGSFIFQQRYGTSQETSYGLVSSFDFNPRNSLEIVIGFSNMSPKLYDFSQPELGYQTLFQNGEQPSYYNNYKIATFLPDGKRVISSDYTEGLGLWPGEPTGDLTYRQGYLFFGLKPFDNGHKILGFVWQQVKVVEIQLQCPSNTQEYTLRQREKNKQKRDLMIFSSCTCTDKDQYWNFYKYLCQNCLQNGINICECPTNYLFMPHLNSCVIQCKQIPHALPHSAIMTQTVSTQYCLCERGYIWKDRKCIFTCDQIQFALSPSGNESCNCLYPFIWDNLAKVCKCPIYSVFTPTSSNFCQCDKYHYIDVATRSCMPDCTKILYTNISDITIHSDQTVCECEKGFTFKQYDAPGSGQITQGCLRDCELIDDTVNGTFGLDLCKCEESTSWKNGKCQIDCTQITNAFQAVTDNETGDVQKCQCAMNYQWVPENKECGRQCSAVKYVNQSEYSTSISCPCNHNFQWDYFANQCIIKCNQINFTQPYALGKGDTCECRQNFEWDHDRSSCLINCSQIWDAKKIRLSDGQCGCNGDKQFNNTALICQAKSNKKLFSSPWVWGVLGFSVLFIILTAAIMSRFCIKFSTDKNKEHEKKLKISTQPKPKKKRMKGMGVSRPDSERLGLK